MKEILHHLIGSYSGLSVYWLCFEYSMHPRCCRNSTLNNSILCLAGSLRCQQTSNSDKFAPAWAVVVHWTTDCLGQWVFYCTKFKQFDWVYWIQHNPKHLGHWNTKQMDFRNPPFWDEPSSGQFLYHFFAAHVLKGVSANFGRLIKRIGMKYLWTMVYIFTTVNIHCSYMRWTKKKVANIPQLFLKPSPIEVADSSHIPPNFSLPGPLAWIAKNLVISHRARDFKPRCCCDDLQIEFSERCSKLRRKTWMKKHLSFLISMILEG